MEIFRPRSDSEFGPYTALFVALVLFIGLMPFVDESGIGASFVRVGFIVVLIAGLGIARESRGVLGIALVLLAINVVVTWLARYLTGDPLEAEALRTVFGSVYLIYLIVLLIRTLSRKREASMDVVLGGINVYLLVALAFMLMHITLEHMVPGSYQRAGVLLSDSATGVHATLDTTMFYFSVSTLTTLGYGDISPVRPVAEFLCAAEAVIGQLYVAIFIGGLVALRINAKGTGDGAPSE
ncbi:MAG: voltage-gated potassium channel [Chlamydiales bacterium]|jgi:voltage-gated potassium channel